MESVQHSTDVHGSACIEVHPTAQGECKFYGIMPTSAPTRAVPNIHLVFVLVLNTGQNKLFV